MLQGRPPPPPNIAHPRTVDNMCASRGPRRRAAPSQLQNRLVLSAVSTVAIQMCRRRKRCCPPAVAALAQHEGRSYATARLPATPRAAAATRVQRSALGKKQRRARWRARLPTIGLANRRAVTLEQRLRARSRTGRPRQEVRNVRSMRKRARPAERTTRRDIGESGWIFKGS